MTDPILSIQLYSGRNFPPVEDQLASVRRAGFTTVELFDPFYDDVAETRRLLQRYGLSARSGHFSLAMVEQNPDGVIEIAQALGMSYVVIPSIARQDRPTDVAGWSAFGRRLQATSDRFGANGLRMAWHNHDFEFMTLEDGSWIIDRILGDNLLWEADVAWIYLAEINPWFPLQRYKGRIPLVHVKDIAGAFGFDWRNVDWAYIGEGDVYWPQNWRTVVAMGPEVMIAEHNDPADFDRFARASFATMQSYVERDRQQL